MLERLHLRLGIRPSERRMVTRLFWLHFILIASYTLARISRNALFLEELRARRLPYLYIAVAAFTALISAAMARLSSQQLLQRSLSQSLAVCGLSLWVFVPIFEHMGGKFPPVALYLWTGAYGLVLLSLYWVLVNEAIDAREAKRLFGVIGAGGVLGGLAAGALGTLLAKAFGPERLLFLAGGLLFAAIPLTVHALDVGSSRVLEIVPRETDTSQGPLRDRYVRLMAIMFLLGGITASILDYQFNTIIENKGQGQAVVMTRYLGYYHLGMNTLAITMQVFAAGYLLRRFGASTVSSLLPAGVVLGSAVTLLVNPASALLIAGTRLYEAGLRVSVGKTSWEFLYFPLSAGVRRRVKGLIDAGVDRSSEAVAGLLILGLNAWLGGSPRQLGVMLVLFAAAWYAANSRLKSAYVRQLSTSLHELVLDVDRKPVMPQEAALIEELHRLLDSPFEKRAIYAFELLETSDPEGLQRRLGALQEHPVATIRARALARLADPKHPMASPLLRNLVHDKSMEVRSEAIRIYAQRFPDSEMQMQNLLASKDEEARSAAIVFMASQSGPEREVEVGDKLERLLREGTVSDRRAVAMALGRRARSSPLHRKLLRLLDDAAPEVQREAVMAAGKALLREFIPALIPHLQRRASRESARTALANYGNRVVGTLGDYLTDETVPIAIRREVPLVLALIATQESANELLRVNFPADPLFLLRLLKAQNKIRVRNAGVQFPRAAVREALEREVQIYLQLSMHQRVWRAEPATRSRDLLLDSLEDRLESTFTRMFRRLGLLYPAQEVFLGYRAFSGRSRRTRAQAAEYLEAILLPEDRRLMMPILDAPPEQRALLAETLYGMTPYTHASSLEALVRGRDAWLQSCALYVIGAEGLRDLVELSRQALQLGHPLVRETAEWSLRRLEVS